ncbi:hypothetical protein HDU84_000901 [Entophlyctis sp. JEL0112]|nr:hypothetical protein HDU84_000901 [Entophlyctis sp. JEL0112]
MQMNFAAFLVAVAVATVAASPLGPRAPQEDPHAHHNHHGRDRRDCVAPYLSCATDTPCCAGSVCEGGVCVVAAHGF